MTLTVRGTVIVGRVVVRNVAVLVLVVGIIPAIKESISIV